MAQLINDVLATGIYQTMDVRDETQLAVELSAISVTKTANMPVWVSGELTYTIVVRNLDTRTEAQGGEAVTELTIADHIETSVATYVADSVEVVLTPDTPIAEPVVAYDGATGMLTIEIEQLIAAQYATITFQVTQVV